MDLIELLPNTRAGNHIAGQFIRCGTSAAFNYAEAKAAESKNDFIHKMKICLKELRESLVCMKIIIKKPLIKGNEKLEWCFKECDELISIFVKSLKTASGK